MPRGSEEAAAQALSNAIMAPHGAELKLPMGTHAVRSYAKGKWEDHPATLTLPGICARG